MDREGDCWLAGCLDGDQAEGSDVDWERPERVRQTNATGRKAGATLWLTGSGSEMALQQPERTKPQAGQRTTEGSALATDHSLSGKSVLGARGQKAAAG
jgi:hypothetical protein